jgi:hypothetical protein
MQTRQCDSPSDRYRIVENSLLTKHVVAAQIDQTLSRAPVSSPSSRGHSLARAHAHRNRREPQSGSGRSGNRETLEELGSIAWSDCCWLCRAHQCRIRPGRRPRPPPPPASGCRRHGVSESRGPPRAPPMLFGFPAEERAGAAASGGEGERRGCRSGSRRA